jgi:hypothetical protein
MSITAATDGSRGESSGPTEPAIDRNDVFHVLRNRRRRYALHALKSRDEPVELGDLAEQVGAWEYDVAPRELTSQQRKRVYNSLQQTHLPELDETGLVDFERGTAELTERAHELDVYLEVVPKRDIPWSRYYLALSAVCSALVAAVWLGAPGLEVFSGISLAAFVTVAFTVSAVAHVIAQRNARMGATTEPPEVREA